MPSTQPPSINKKSPIPAYHQIAQDMRNRIAQGEWDVSEKLPSEASLAAEYHVSRVTLRQAMAHLEDRGIIQRHQGKGAFVYSSPKPFVEDLSFPAIGANPRSRSKARLLSIAMLDQPTRHAVASLGVDPDTPLVFLQRLFVRKNVILGLNNVWFPATLVPGIVEDGLVNDSITQTLAQRYRYTIQRIENTIEATRLSVRDAQLLDAPLDSPAMKVQSVHFLSDGRAVEYATTLWLGDLARFRFVVEGTE